MSKFGDLKRRLRELTHEEQGNYSITRKVNRDGHEASYAIEELENVVRELYEWIDADEGFATDFPEEWERLTNMAKDVLGEDK